MKTWLAILLVSSFAFAGESMVAIKGQEATVKLASGDVTLKQSGTGIRQKTKLLLTFNVYNATSFVNDVTTLRKAATPVEGMRQQKVKVLKLDMLRALSAAEIRQSFEEALITNGVDVDAEAVQNIFNQWSSGVKAGDSIVLVGFEEKGEDKIVIEVGGKTITSAAKDISFDFFKIWFGKGDAGIVALQKQLVGKD